jgi:phosphatidylglycerophosphate synthase
MSISALVLNDSDISLWGLTSRRRLQRQLREIGGVDWIEKLSELPASGKVLLLDGGYLFEVRTLAGLLDVDNAVLVCGQDDSAAALVCEAGLAADSAAFMLGESSSPPGGVETVTTASFAAFDENLRRSKAPLLEPVNAGNREKLESELYGNAYRGITDLVTKFLWPRPARKAVRIAANLGMSPNMVTSIGFVLVLAACWFFLQGQYAAGLLAGWIMTFLDTVDGKLARVTVQSSHFGHLFDHAIDLFHPPFWYIFWGMSLVEFQPVLGLDRPDMYWMIVIAYVLGRLVEGIFPLLGDCSVFTWKPFDAWFRLVTARRNPCLIILTASVLAGRPDWGFVAVASWSALTTAVLVLRLLQGLAERLRRGPLVSWMSEDGVAAGPHADSYRVFGSTRGAYRGE